MLQDDFNSLLSYLLFYRHAFLLYDTEQLAANVIKHADQYHVNGQPLIISFYRNKKSIYASTKELLVK